MSPSTSPPAARSRSRDAAVADSSSTKPAFASFLSNPAARMIVYIALMAFSNYVCMASQFSLFKFVGCKAYWAKREPGNIPLPDSEMCDLPKVAALAGSILAVIAIVSSATGLLMTALVQRMADRFGRKPLLVCLPLLDLVYLALLVLGFDTNSIKLSYPLLIGANVISAVSAKAWTFMPSLVIADVADVEERTPWFARLQAANLGSGGIAFLCSSLLATAVPYKYSPYVVAAGTDTLAVLWALFLIPETRVHRPDAIEAAQDSPQESIARRVGSAILSPLKPLRLCWPSSQDSRGGKRSWNMLLLSVTLFVSIVGQQFPYTALVLYLQDRFRFSTSANGYVLAYMQATRVFVLVLVFPLVLKIGRRAFHRWQVRHPLRVPAGSVEEGTIPNSEDERTPLLAGGAEAVIAPGDVLVVEDRANTANHFDVILAFVTLIFDFFGYLGVFLSYTWQQVIGCFTILGFGSPLTSTLRSTFLAAVKPEQASESMAAFSIIVDISALLSPAVMGPVFAWFTSNGVGERLFVVTAFMSILASSFLFFVRRI